MDMFLSLAFQGHWYLKQHAFNYACLLHFFNVVLLCKKKKKKKQ